MTDAPQTPKLTQAQRAALLSAWREAVQIQRLRERAATSGAILVIDPARDYLQLPLSCDARSRGVLVEAGLLTWACGFDTLVNLTAAGLDLARQLSDTH